MASKAIVMITGAPTWLSASAVFFLYIAVVAALHPGLRPLNRRTAIAAAVAGLFATLVTAAVPLHVVLRDWVLPPLLLGAGYWVSGLLFIAPMPSAERLLLRVDRLLGICPVTSVTPRPAAEFLEIAYAAVYPVIPLALIIQMLATDQGDAERFWSVILITDFICFGMLPWVQTRPPRLLESAPPWRARFRALNLRMLGAASIKVNTFPSGHAAEALAAALLVLDAPFPLVLWMFFNALAISAGAVLGRYHFAADAMTGWAVAAGVWMLLKG